MHADDKRDAQVAPGEEQMMTSLRWLFIAAVVAPRSPLVRPEPLERRAPPVAELARFYPFDSGEPEFARTAQPTWRSRLRVWDGAWLG